MNIEQFNRQTKGFFKAGEDDKEAGTISYRYDSEDILVIEHTVVNPEFKGRGVGKLLVMAVVEYARKEGIKVKAECPYAQHVFDKDPDLHDVL